VLVNGTTEPEAAWANGRFVSQLTEQTGRDGLDTACDLIIQDRGATTMAIFMMSMDDVRGVLASPIAGVGSDLYAVVSAETANHPRCCGSFARVLAWSREGLVPLEEAVRKMTSLGADTIGLTDRGRVQPGLVADLVAFDPATVADRATWQEPARLATGVEHVLLGGRFAVQQGRPVNLRLGGVVRRDATRSAGPRPS
jgi:N-acyl-D-amino-acid deacylase